MSNTLDLNELSPQDMELSFGGKVIKVRPLRLKKLFRISNLLQKFQATDTMTDDEVDAVENELRARVVEVIPEIQEEDLSSGLLLGLCTFLIENSMPKKADQLAKRGITVDTAKKAQ